MRACTSRRSHKSSGGNEKVSFRSQRLHIIEVLLLAIFIGLVIFMILSLDRPFRGDLGIRADPYQLVYDQLMKSNP